MFSLILVAIGIRVGCLGLVLGAGWETSILRQGLVLIPAFFVEGFVMAVCARAAVLGESLEVGKISAVRFVLGSAILNVLMQMFFAFFIGLMTQVIGDDGKGGLGAADDAPASGAMLLPALAIFVAMIWAFRLFWLPVCLAMGIEIKPFLRHVRGFGTSFQMMGLWALCSVPMFVLMLVLYKVIMMDAPEADAAGSGLAANPIMFALSVVLQSSFDVVISVIGACGMAFGIVHALRGPPDQKLF
jgi:hypothetical protein